ncbi:hypothetical protein GCM10007971_07260 [Oceanobacillus indicireducens]|uniref:Uncharacterized protein n=1 Tax=Oceanobacillus indicireducens TaxID=1004261 RepID=A0A917XT59_9BACI|nr:hypothetical protein GCM10007971_07260 [Oceanobacillus indicireducens]
MLERILSQIKICPNSTNGMELDGEGYIPYTRTKITDALHEVFGFRADFEIAAQKSKKF